MGFHFWLLWLSVWYFSLWEKEICFGRFGWIIGLFDLLDLIFIQTRCFLVFFEDSLLTIFVLLQQISCTIRSMQKKRNIPIIVRVSDVNDNPPKFVNTPYEATIAEVSLLFFYSKTYIEILWIGSIKVDRLKKKIGYVRFDGLFEWNLFTQWINCPVRWLLCEACSYSYNNM